MIKIFLVLLVIIYGTLSFSGTIDPNTPDEKYINYGLKFPYIGQIIGRKQDDTSYSGSVVAYKNNIIITAAHIFHNNKTAVVIFSTKLLPVKKIVIHKNYDYEKFGRHDIAVCLVSGDIGLDWYPDIYKNNQENGSICSLAGYGSTGTFITGILPSKESKKRAGSNFIDAVNEYLLFCSPSVKTGKTELEFIIAPGDSGGGLFIGNDLAGIHSGVIEDKINKGKSKYGAVSAHTRVSVYKDWIENTTQELLKDK
jgi:hypothetical protein